MATRRRISFSAHWALAADPCPPGATEPQLGSAVKHGAGLSTSPGLLGPAVGLSAQHGGPLGSAVEHGAVSAASARTGRQRLTRGEGDLRIDPIDLFGSQIQGDLIGVAQWRIYPGLEAVISQRTCAQG